MTLRIVVGSVSEMAKFKISIDHSELFTAKDEIDCMNLFIDKVSKNPKKFLQDVVEVEKILDVELYTEEEMLNKYR